MTTQNTWFTRSIVTLLFTASLVAIGLKYIPLLKSNQTRRAILIEKRQKLNDLTERERQLQSDNEALKSDPKTVERAAREVLGYARPDEKVVTFEERKK